MASGSLVEAGGNGRGGKRKGGEGRRGEGGQLNIHQTSMGLNIRPNICLLMKAVFA